MICKEFFQGCVSGGIMLCFVWNSTQVAHHFPTTLQMVEAVLTAKGHSDSCCYVSISLCIYLPIFLSEYVFLAWLLLFQPEM